MNPAVQFLINRNKQAKLVNEFNYKNILPLKKFFSIKQKLFIFKVFLSVRP